MGGGGGYFRISVPLYDTVLETQCIYEICSGWNHSAGGCNYASELAHGCIACNSHYLLYQGIPEFFISHKFSPSIVMDFHRNPVAWKYDVGGASHLLLFLILLFVALPSLLLM